MRAHRAFRQLNNLLNRAGMNVLRFDYSSTGDSFGDGIEASVDQWLTDIDSAIDELKANSMTEKVSVVGLRWGAVLAAKACANRADVEHILLWDPVVSGREYVDKHFGTQRPESVVGLEGYPFTPSFLSELDKIDLLETLQVGWKPDVTVLVAEDTPVYQKVYSALRNRGRCEHFEVVPSSGNWAVADPFGDALIPQRIMQAVVDRLLARLHR